MADNPLTATGIALVVVGTAFIVGEWFGVAAAAAYCSVFGAAFIIRSLVGKQSTRGAA